MEGATKAPPLAEDYWLLEESELSLGMWPDHW